MTVKEYQKIVNKTAQYPEDKGISYCTHGLTGEAGEVANKVKKLYRDGVGTAVDDQMLKDMRGISQEVDDWCKDLAKEVGDIIWYCAALAQELGTNLEEVMQANYDKLMKRKKEGTIKGSGDNR